MEYVKLGDRSDYNGFSTYKYLISYYEEESNKNAIHRLGQWFLTGIIIIELHNNSSNFIISESHSGSIKQLQNDPNQIQNIPIKTVKALLQLIDSEIRCSDATTELAAQVLLINFPYN